MKVRGSAAWAIGITLLLVGCITIPVEEGVYEPEPETREYAPISGLSPGEFFTTELQTSSKAFASGAEVRAASARIDDEYRLGPGDRFAFLVRGREAISREEIIVAPDGNVALPQVGILNVNGQTLPQLTTLLEEKLKRDYEDPEVTLVMKAFNNNRVFVLGRVANPGAIDFQGPGTLLEALSLAGGLPADEAKSFLSRCMIVRGNNLVMWIDLKALLERGNMALNARLRNGDVIFIPQSEDQLAYVMGEVESPGVVPLRSELTVLDAVMGAGGPTKGANLRDVFLVRQMEGKGAVVRIDMKALIASADYRRNYALRDGDLIYVPPTGLSKLNYIATQLLPAFTIVGITASTAANLGLTEGFGDIIYGGGVVVE